MATLTPTLRQQHSNPSCTIVGANYTMFADPWVMGCGVGMLEHFPYSHNWSWEQMADAISGIYKALYTCGNTLYAIPETKLQYPLHLALVEMGAKKIDEFPNLYHGPSIMHVFRVNVRNAEGRFCDRYGDPLPSKPENPPEPYEHKFENLNNGSFNKLPVKA